MRHLSCHTKQQAAAGEILCMAACSTRVRPADSALLMQAAPSWSHRLLEAQETAPVDEVHDEEACAAVGEITAQVRWQAWPRQRRW